QPAVISHLIRISMAGSGLGSRALSNQSLSLHRGARVANPDNGAPDPTPPQPHRLPQSDLPAFPPSCYLRSGLSAGSYFTISQ
ncbi:MAG TPA: hypothetical protein VN914_01585, partial [Polyangia bacterium]|nr:hypothetical protein [Polyangia bacterium]